MTDQQKRLTRDLHEIQKAISRLRDSFDEDSAGFFECLRMLRSVHTVADRIRDGSDLTQPRFINNRG